MATGTVLRDRRAYIWGIQVMRLGGLAALLATIFVVKPGPGLHGQGLALSITLAVASAAWLGMVAMDLAGRSIAVPVAVMGVTGGITGTLQDTGPAIAVAGVAALAAGSNLEPQTATAIAVAAGCAVTITALVVGGVPAIAVVGFLAIIGTALGMGLIRYGHMQRAVQAEQLLEQTRRASRAEAEAAALNERTRIAREIHDILAHSLGALALQVEAAQALLEQENPDVSKALQCVERAGQLTRTGLVESRRAILALREDSGLLPDAIGNLVAAEDGMTLTTRGEPRRLAPDATLALYRTAQEAVTNARKHAPGRPVTLELEFGSDAVRLTVANPLATDGDARPLADSGAGFGLAGLRERAELAGGTLTAEAEDGAWVVRAAIPG